MLLPLIHYYAMVCATHGYHRPGTFYKKRGILLSDLVAIGSSYSYTLIGRFGLRLNVSTLGGVLNTLHVHIIEVIQYVFFVPLHFFAARKRSPNLYEITRIHKVVYREICTSYKS